MLQANISPHMHCVIFDLMRLYLLASQREMKNGSKGGSFDQVDGESGLITNHQKAFSQSSKDYVTGISPCTSSTLRFVLSQATIEGMQYPTSCTDSK